MCVNIFIVTLLAVCAESLPILNLQGSQFDTNSFIHQRHMNQNRNAQRWYASYYNDINNHSEKSGEMYGVSPVYQRNNIKKDNIFRRDNEVVLNNQPPQLIEPEKVYTEPAPNSDFNIKRTHILENSYLHNSKNSQSLDEYVEFVFDTHTQANKKNPSEYTFNLQENLNNVQNTSNGVNNDNHSIPNISTSEMHVNNGKISEIPIDNINGHPRIVFYGTPVGNINTNDREANGTYADGSYGIKTMAPGVKKADEENNIYLWGEDETTTIIPDIENRVSFDGGTCPTGQKKLAGKCVIVDS